MSTNLSASIQKLRESASKLNELTDQANLTVQTVEHLLRDELKIGTTVAVQVNDSSQENGSSRITGRLSDLVRISSSVDVAPAGTYGTFLCYCKYGSSFRITVIKKSTTSDSVTAWSDCPRDLKLETIRKLPELVSKLVAELNKRIHDAEFAVADISAVLGIETGQNVQSGRARKSGSHNAGNKGE